MRLKGFDPRRSVQIRGKGCWFSVFKLIARGVPVRQTSITCFSCLVSRFLVYLARFPLSGKRPRVGASGAGSGTSIQSSAEGSDHGDSRRDVNVHSRSSRGPESTSRPGFDLAKSGLTSFCRANRISRPDHPASAPRSRARRLSKHEAAGRSRAADGEGHRLHPAHSL